MPLFEFSNESCPSAPDGRAAACLHEIMCRGAVPIGKEVKCPVKGCCGRVKRVVSSPAIIIKGSVLPNWESGQSMRMNLDGQEVRFTFIDHPETDPQARRNLAALAQRAGVREVQGLSNARYDPKYGRVVVDVASNVEDPLGMLSRNEKKGNVEKQTRKVSHPFRRRKGKK